MIALISALGATSCAATGELGIGQSALGEDGFCPEAYFEAAEHTCAHAESGPFATVTAAATIDAALANINLSHTAYTVQLQPVEGSYQGAVRYRPIELADHLFFTATAVPITVVDGSGAVVEPELQGTVDSAACSLLSHFSQYQLDPAVTYRVFFGPSEQSSALVLVEHLDEFASACETCEPIELRASRSYRPSAFEVANVTLDEPIVFELPTELPVVMGNAGNGLATLSFSDVESGSTVVCLYQGVGPFCPSTPAELEATSRYLLSRCSNGAVAGQDIETDRLGLRVISAGDRGRNARNEVELVIEPECGGHDHGDEH